MPSEPEDDNDSVFDPEKLETGEDFFLSYARENQDVVRKIHEALKEKDYHGWVDWAGIAPTDRWKRAIGEAIERCQAFVFVISPASVKSEVCFDTELSHAIDVQKKIVPVVVDDFESEKIPEKHTALFHELREINYVFLREDDDFEKGIEKIIEAITTDLDHVRRHTQYLLTARIWESEQEQPSRLLRGRSLRAAEDWIAGIGAREPRAK